MDQSRMAANYSERGRSKSDTTPRDERYAPPSAPYMRHLQDLEEAEMSMLDGQSDLNVHGGEYRPRSVSNTQAQRGRPSSSNQRMAQATRHARRLYFGGFSVSTEEDRLKKFLSDVISTALREPNDNSYILSIYLNQKKCFAFVELKSIELTSACLSLDGVLMDGFPLKVQRANEYKPDLVPSVKNPIQLDLSKIPRLEGGSLTTKNENQSGTGDNSTWDHVVVQQVDVAMLKHGDVALLSVSQATNIGSGGSVQGDVGDSHQISSRRAIKSFLHSVSSSNPEYGVDISDVHVVDVGDLQLTPDDIETDGGRSAVQKMICSILAAGAIPVVIGGIINHKSKTPINGGDNGGYLSAGAVCSASVRGIAAAMSQENNYAPSSSRGATGVAVMSVSSKIHRFCPHLLTDSGFVGRSAYGGESCDGRLRAFGLQGSHCSMDSARNLLSRGALLTWLTRDIRHSERKSSDSSTFMVSFDHNGSKGPSVTASTAAGNLFLESVQKLSYQRDVSSSSVGTLGSSHSGSGPRSLLLCLHPDASLFQNAGGTAATCPLGPRCVVCSDPSCLGGEGFTPAEWLDMARVAGQHKNVGALDLTAWSAVVGCHRLPSMLLGNIFYNFLLGVALSRSHVGESPSKLFSYRGEYSTGSIQNNRNIFEAFKYDSLNKTLSSLASEEDAEISMEDFPPTRRASVSDATVPYGLEKKSTSPGVRDNDSGIGSGMKSYSSLGISIPVSIDTTGDDEGEADAEGSRAAAGHGLFADTPGSFIARGALSLLESPVASNSADIGDLLPPNNLPPPKE